MTFTVLIVCQANICRSPLTAALLDRALRGHLVRHHVRVNTCGLAAEPGAPACPVVTRALAHDPESRPTLAMHRASLLEPAMLAEAGLVLTADRRARAGVVRMMPQSHGRVFTLREAEQLSLQLRETFRETPLGGNNLGPSSLRGDMDDRLHELVIQLDAQRGMGDLVRTERRWALSAPWRPLSVHGHDVPDAHVDRAPHRLVLRLTGPAITHIAEVMTTFASSSQRGPTT